MKLTSDTFRNRAAMPAACAFVAGGNRSPQLRWSEVPAGVASLVVLCMLGDAPDGDVFHWGAVDIPPSQASVAEGASEALRQGLNDFGTVGYHGPLPVRNETHHYIFRIYALDVARLALPARFSCADVLTAMYGHIVDEAQLIGTYTHI
ncbi:YbhB/YbcL family Raf kinase inhibitor-like protein [Pseudoduganella sp. FT26W]|uniref:YbhB/YbcL family Raf kinase inhibitor-like protein n=1 Tax=Duganella aquatilis TaxID=2666082 RepID=A0A844D9E9_9BURK|nr:YbhB/YbcL family Raf kinase inhibitor-like protein [Duganella aquatilis]MRW83624.1 YbhB/YbcL family Raf kinase inhibitor-like protein [Duganella aquatilis]